MVCHTGGVLQVHMDSSMIHGISLSMNIVNDGTKTAIPVNGLYTIYTLCYLLGRLCPSKKLIMAALLNSWAAAYTELCHAPFHSDCQPCNNPYDLHIHGNNECTPDYKPHDKANQHWPVEWTHQMMECSVYWFDIASSALVKDMLLPADHSYHKGWYTFKPMLPLT